MFFKFKELMINQICGNGVRVIDILKNYVLNLKVVWVFVVICQINMLFGCVIYFINIIILMNVIIMYVCYLCVGVINIVYFVVIIIVFVNY